MKRLITIICLILVIILGYVMINKGFDNSIVDVASYNTIEKKSAALTKKLASYNKRNQEGFTSAEGSLDTAIKSYQDSKSKYEDIYNELSDSLANNEANQDVEQQIEQVIYSDQEIYDIDFLQITLGRYAAKEGVDVDFKLVTSSTTDPTSIDTEYFLADLQFTVTGAYYDVTNFISDIENDDKLGWEINNFTMNSGSSNGYTGVTATFTTKSIPINSQSYLESVATDNNGGITDQTSNTVNGNTVGNTAVNNVSTTNSTNTVNVTNTTNTVSNTVTNSVQ